MAYPLNNLGEREGYQQDGTFLIQHGPNHYQFLGGNRGEPDHPLTFLDKIKACFASCLDAIKLCFGITQYIGQDREEN